MTVRRTPSRRAPPTIAWGTRLRELSVEEQVARSTAVLIGLEHELRDDEITVLEGWAGDLYGIPVDSTLDATRLTGQLDGVIIEPVYEDTSMAGLIELVSSGEIPQESTVLYAHLGGHLALNAYIGLFTHPAARSISGAATAR